MNVPEGGYTTEVPFSGSYYVECSLPRLRLALLHNGWTPPDVTTACELGFGHGLSLAIHAAASPAVWYGTDINRDHVADTARLTSASGARAELHADNIVDFAHRSDLPDFDFVAVNFVWSWISDEIREAIVDFVRRKLKPGGVLFLSYISLPGWAPFVPVRELLAEYASKAGGGTAPLVDRIDASLDFFRRLRQVRPGYLEDNPGAVGYLDDLDRVSRNDVAHDLFTHYHPMAFSKVAGQLAAAGLAPAGSADMGDLDVLRLTVEQRQLLTTITDPVLRESVRDFLVNRFARRDYFIKQPAGRLSEDQRRAALRATRFVAVTPDPALPPKMRALLALQGTRLTDGIVQATMERMRDFAPCSLREAETMAHEGGATGFEQALTTLLLATGLGQIAPLPDSPEETATRRRFTAALNTHLTAKDDAHWLASPLTGAGVKASVSDRALLKALGIA